MKRVLTITSDETLVEGLEEALGADEVDFEEVPDWSEASETLVAETFEGACIDYESIKIEGFDAFVQLDNMLQKEATEAVLLLREETERARQFADTLDSFAAAVNLAGDSVDRFRTELLALLDQRDDPDQTPDRPRKMSTLEVELPVPAEGALGEPSIARLVHAIRRREQTGLLELSSGEMQRRFAFRDGRLLEPRDADTSPTKTLKAAFAWSSGSYLFESDDPRDGETSDPYPVLLRGAIDHLDQRTAMQALTSRMDRYAIPTNLWRNRPDTFEKIDDLHTIVEACDGGTTLEQILSAVASRALKGFQAAFFAVECDFVVLVDEPVSSWIAVDFVDTASDAAGPASSQVSEPTTAEREDQLRERHAEIVEADPYETLELWEGCGEDLVRSRYFELVKTNHPDAYGGNISEEGKRLAEEIFINIKEAYSELLRREDEQTIPPTEARGGEGEAAGDLSSSLESPSVTALGSGQADQEAGAEGSSAETVDVARDGEDDPQATMPPGSGRDDETTVSVQTDDPPLDEPTAPRGGDDPDVTIPPESPSGGASDDRRKKLEKLRRRASSNSVAGTADGGTPDDRQSKLDGLRKSAGSQMNERVDNLEGAETDDEAQEYFNRGYKAYKNENHQKALQYFEQAHEFDEDNGLFKTFYGYLQFLTDPDKKDDAQQLLREALKSDNQQAQPDAHLFFGRILKVKDEHHRAKRHFERAVELNPNSIEAKRELRVYEMREQKGKSPTGEDQNAGTKIKDLLNKDLF